MRKSLLSQHKQNKLIDLFVVDMTARTAIVLANINKATLAYVKDKSASKNSFNIIFTFCGIGILVKKIRWLVQHTDTNGNQITIINL